MRMKKSVALLPGWEQEGPALCAADQLDQEERGGERK